MINPHNQRPRHSGLILGQDGLVTLDLVIVSAISPLTLEVLEEREFKNRGICSDVLKIFTDNRRKLENGHDHRRNTQGRVH